MVQQASPTAVPLRDDPSPANNIANVEHDGNNPLTLEQHDAHDVNNAGALPVSAEGAALGPQTERASARIRSNLYNSGYNPHLYQIHVQKAVKKFGDTVVRPSATAEVRQLLETGVIEGILESDLTLNKE